MRPLIILLAPLLILIAMAMPAGATSAGVTALLRSYSVPNSLISNLVQVNITYNGTGYAALYDSGQLNFVVDTATNSFVVSQQQIFSIIRNYTVSSSFSDANMSGLSGTMHKYMQTASAPLADCVAETGLSNPGASCTLQNNCQSCHTVSYCSKVLLSVGGPDTPVGEGFINFDVNYTDLEASLLTFFDTVNTTTSSNFAASLPEISSSFNSIYSITTTMWKNPIFPPNANITQSQVSQCFTGPGGTTLNSSLPNAPWYCNSVGFCPYLTVKDSLNEPIYRNQGFNFSVLNEMQYELRNIESLPVSNSQVEAIAASANSVTTQYIEPVLSRQKTGELDSLLNTSLKGYGATANASATLLTHISNASLAASLAALQANYSILTSQYLNLNITKQGAIVANQLAVVTSVYKAANASYSSLVSESDNNTGRIITLELDGNANNPSLSSLAFMQLRLNSQLSGRVSNTIAIKTQLDSVKSGLGSLGSGENPLVLFSRSLGSSSAMALSPMLGLPYNAAVSLAPVTASIPALIIGIIGLALVGVAWSVIKPKKQNVLPAQHNMHPLQKHVHKHIMNGKLLIAIAVLLVLYIAISVGLSFLNNASAPISSFNKALASSSDVVLVLNGTHTSGMLTCYSQVQARLKLLGKGIINANINGAMCTVSNTTLTSGSCLNAYASKGVPIITLTNSSVSGISAYSFYGSMLTESGNSADLARCTAAQVI